MRKKLNSENIKACYNPRQTDTCFRSSAKLLLFGIVAWLCDSVVFVMHWFSKSVRCQKKYTATALEGHSLLFAFFHQSPSARKKKRKPFGADNDDDNNDEGWYVGGWSFHVIILWFSHHLIYWRRMYFAGLSSKRGKNEKAVGAEYKAKVCPVTKWMRDRLTERLSDWIMSDGVTDWVTEWWVTEWTRDWVTD